MPGFWIGRLIRRIHAVRYVPGMTQRKRAPMTASDDDGRVADEPRRRVAGERVEDHGQLEADEREEQRVQDEEE